MGDWVTTTIGAGESEVVDEEVVEVVDGDPATAGTTLELVADTIIGGSVDVVMTVGGLLVVTVDGLAVKEKDVEVVFMPGKGPMKYLVVEQVQADSTPTCRIVRSHSTN